MAHPGYLGIGLHDPAEGRYTHEIINTNRAITYVNAEGALPWLLECGVCPDINPVLPDGIYGTVKMDPAPWYSPRKIDSGGFYGVIGLELEGIDDSTRKANVRTALRGGGVIGATYLEARTIVARAIAVAADEPSLSYGLRWLSEQFIDDADPCQGDILTFFETCPDANCDEGEDFPVGPCWPQTYAELRDGPPCAPDWWPTTYGEWKAGPPYLQDLDSAATTGDWCDWAGVYREVRDWLPPWNCCYELRVMPRMKSMPNSRVTEGPTVLSRPLMSVGAMAEIEFTVTAGSPQAERMPYNWPDTWRTGTVG